MRSVAASTRTLVIVVAANLGFATSGAAAPQPAAATDYAGDAKALDRLIVENYAYEDHWPGGVLPDSPALAAEREAVHDGKSLLHYAEHRIASLADHHAITASSFKDSWAVVPTYSDLWIERRGANYVVGAVRQNSPAMRADIRAGDMLVEINGVPTGPAINAFWSELGLQVTPERADYAARVLAAGRRDRSREVTVRRGAIQRSVKLPSLYGPAPEKPPLTVSRVASKRTIIRFNNSLDDQATIAAFDGAMAAVPAQAPLVIDLTDTPSGGNTSVARAIMGWFINRPAGYQMHQLSAEEREMGIRRQWIEQVVPRPGKRHLRLPVVRVGRWTGSMGEGLAIGFSALGARVEGAPMAQLKGAVYDFTLPSSGMAVKLPAERLYTVGGLPREKFMPKPAASQ